MSKRSLAETLVFVSLLFINGLSVRACSGVHIRVRGCFGGVRVVFGYRSGPGFFAIFGYVPKNRTKRVLSVHQIPSFKYKLNSFFF